MCVGTHKRAAAAVNLPDGTPLGLGFLYERLPPSRTPRYGYTGNRRREAVVLRRQLRFPATKILARVYVYSFNYPPPPLSSLSLLAAYPPPPAPSCVHLCVPYIPPFSIFSPFFLRHAPDFLACVLRPRARVFPRGYQRVINVSFSSLFTRRYIYNKIVDCLVYYVGMCRRVRSGIMYVLAMIIVLYKLCIIM